MQSHDEGNPNNIILGQYNGIYEYIENVFARNITCIGTRYAAYIKTWTGIQQNYPPNGGGGGTGVVRNISEFPFTKYFISRAEDQTYL